MKHHKSNSGIYFFIIITLSLNSCSHYYSKKTDFFHYFQNKLNHDFKLYQQIINLDKKSQKVRISQFSFDRSEYNYFSGLLFEDKKDYTGAIKFYEAGVKKHQLFQEDCFLHLASIYLVTENISKAEKLKKKVHIKKSALDEYYLILFQQVEFIIDINSNNKKFNRELKNNKVIINQITNNINYLNKYFNREIHFKLKYLLCKGFFQQQIYESGFSLLLKMINEYKDKKYNSAIQELLAFYSTANHGQNVLNALLNNGYKDNRQKFKFLLKKYIKQDFSSSTYYLVKNIVNRLQLESEFELMMTDHYEFQKLSFSKSQDKNENFPVNNQKKDWDFLYHYAFSKIFNGNKSGYENLKAIESHFPIHTAKGYYIQYHLMDLAIKNGPITEKEQDRFINLLKHYSHVTAVRIMLQNFLSNLILENRQKSVLFLKKIINNIEINSLYLKSDYLLKILNTKKSKKYPVKQPVTAENPIFFYNYFTLRSYPDLVIRENNNLEIIKKIEQNSSGLLKRRTSKIQLLLDNQLIGKAEQLSLYGFKGNDKLSLLANLIPVYNNAQQYYHALKYSSIFLQNLPSEIKINELPKRYLKYYFPRHYANILEDICTKYNLEKELVFALIREESHFDFDALSRSGAIGLMQIMPKTGSWLAGLLRLKQYSLLDENDNLELGCYYLRRLLDKYGNYEHALAAYNGGPGNVDKWLTEFSRIKNLDVFLEVLPFEETRNYVRKVMRSYWMYKKL